MKIRISLDPKAETVSELRWAYDHRGWLVYACGDYTVAMLGKRATSVGLTRAIERHDWLGVKCIAMHWIDQDHPGAIDATMSAGFVRWRRPERFPTSLDDGSVPPVSDR